MCGIVGCFSVGTKVRREAVELGTMALKHRGPDAAGIYVSESGSLLFGHRRLSILDLSSFANQPMTTADGRYTIVFNGEVYNFRELRKELEKSGCVFHTQSDTEVVLAAWIVWGSEAPTRFNGMFAFAVWDDLRHELFLCRDRLGIKPLFYAVVDSCLVFASEMKALWPLLSELGFRKEIDRGSVAAFLHMGFVPEPDTIFRGIRKFPAGHWGCFNSQGKLELHSWWNSTPYLVKNEQITDSSAEETLHTLLCSSVEYRMISDVPFGTFLSGGTDSSLVTAIASEISPQPVKTFSIGFDEARFDESRYAEQVARTLGTDHHAFRLSYKDAAPLLLEMGEVFDEPFGDTSAIPTMMVSRLAREQVTVILTGDGGDELFQGYGAYAWARRLAHPLAGTARSPLQYFLAKSGRSRFQRAAFMFEKEGRQSPRDHIFSQEQYYFSNTELSELLEVKNSRLYRYQDPVELPQSLTPQARQAFFDLNVYLKDDLLTKVDRASMRYGLECRVPLLDYRIVAFALGLGDSLKVRKGTTKWLLKKLLERYLPGDLIYRKKWGFSVPLGDWLKSDLRWFLEENLSVKTLNEYGYVNDGEVARLKASFYKGQDFLYNRLWALAHLHHWLRHNA